MMILKVEHNYVFSSRNADPEDVTVAIFIAIIVILKFENFPECILKTSLSFEKN